MTTPAQPEPTRAELEAAKADALKAIADAAVAWVCGSAGGLQHGKAIDTYGAACQALGEYIGQMKAYGDSAGLRAAYKAALAEAPLCRCPVMVVHAEGCHFYAAGRRIEEASAP